MTGTDLISFINGTATNIGRSTFYNLSYEQRQSLVDQHIPVMEEYRPFYILMSLSDIINDVNKQLIAHNIIFNTIREDNLKDNQHSPMVKWENQVILQSLDNMQPNRVLDLFVNFVKSKGKRRSRWVMSEYLNRNIDKLDFWAIKYRTDLKIILRHIHADASKNNTMTKIWNYIRYKKKVDTGVIKTYEDVRSGDQSKLPLLPISVAEGFRSKFNLSQEEFFKLFEKQGKLTSKETRLRTESFKRVGADTKFDYNKAKLMDLLVYWNSINIDQLPSVSECRKILRNKAKEHSNLNFKFNDVGVIFDNSKSMLGTKDQVSPLIKGLAIALVLEHMTEGSFNMYYTNDPGRSLFPKIGGQSNYGTPILEALKSSKTIVIIGDGYENSPYSGYANQILYAYKKKINSNLMVLHLNPVYGAEMSDVRSVSDLVSAIGIRSVKVLEESLFLCLAKSNPKIAIQKYIGRLVNRQRPEVLQSMPEDIKSVISKNKLIGA
jgi:hypothetical protein